MNIETVRDYCLMKPGVTEEFPFDDVTLVFKVKGKMFALLPTDEIELQLGLKCEPERAVELREIYPAIVPGYHLNKMHWNTVKIDGSVPDNLVFELIDHSYELVVAGLPKKLRDLL